MIINLSDVIHLLWLRKTVTEFDEWSRDIEDQY